MNNHYIIHTFTRIRTTFSAPTIIADNCFIMMDHGA